MLRSENKINAIINNAKCYKKIREEFGSFCDYLWAYSDGKTIIYNGHKDGKIPVSNGLSKTISKDLKKRGFKYIGEITIYSHLQACGIINDHAKDCPVFDRINKNYPTIKKNPDNDVLIT
jgi:DNA-3-methyladenine glycosylase I